MVALKGCISVNNQEEFSRIFHQLKKDEIFREITGNINKKYIQDNIGATEIIMNYVSKKID